MRSAKSPRFTRTLDTRHDGYRSRKVQVGIVAGDRYCDGRCIGLRRMCISGCWLFQVRLRFVQIGYEDEAGIRLHSYAFLRCPACLQQEDKSGR